MRNLEKKIKLFKKLRKIYYEISNETEMSDKEYSKLLELWDKIITMENEYGITEE